MIWNRLFPKNTFLKDTCITVINYFENLWACRSSRWQNECFHGHACVVVANFHPTRFIRTRKTFPRRGHFASPFLLRDRRMRVLAVILREMAMDPVKKWVFRLISRIRCLLKERKICFHLVNKGSFEKRSINIDGMGYLTYLEI